MKLRFKITGLEINEPNNYAETAIDVTFEKNEVFESVGINSWEFGVGDGRNPNDALNIIKNYIERGLLGDPGVFEGLPYVIELDNEMGTTYTLFDGFLDISSSKVESDRITAPAIEQGNLDWLANRAEGFSFEYLFSIGKITRDDFVPIPYVINKKQHASETIIAIVTIFIVTNQLANAIKEIQKSAAGSTNPFQLMDVVKLILDLLFIIALFISLVSLVFELYKALVQPVKYHYGMYIKDLLRIGFDHIGLKFRSSILQKHPWDKALIMPEKFNIQEGNTGIFKNVVGNLKVNTNEKVGFYKGDFGQLLSEMITFFYAKTGVDNGTYYLEKHNYSTSVAKYQLPNIPDTGYEFNADEFISNFIIEFLLDTGDRNTIQEYLGTKVQIIIEPKVVTNKKMLLTKGFERTTINYALGKRKTELNYLERTIDNFLKELVDTIKTIVNIINLVVKSINNVIAKINSLIKKLKVLGIKVGVTIPSLPGVKVPEFVNMIDGSRLNMLKMESDFVTVPKLLMIEKKANPRNNVLLPGMETFLNARHIWKTFHAFKSFAVQPDGSHNQHLFYRFNEIPFTFDNYADIRRSREILDYNSEPAKIDNFKFKPAKELCSGVYKLNKLYTTNLTEKIIEPDGK